VLYLLS